MGSINPLMNGAFRNQFVIVLTNKKFNKFAAR
jgi:hypothetical protein